MSPKLMKVLVELAPILIAVSIGSVLGMIVFNDETGGSRELSWYATGVISGLTFIPAVLWLQARRRPEVYPPDDDGPEDDPMTDYGYP